MNFKNQYGVLMCAILVSLLGCSGGGNGDAGKSTYVGNTLITNECVGHICVGEPYQTAINLFAFMEVKTTPSGGHLIIEGGKEMLKLSSDSSRSLLDRVEVFSPLFSTLSKEHIGTQVIDFNLLGDTVNLRYDDAEDQLYIAPAHLSRINKKTGLRTSECRLYVGDPISGKVYPQPITPDDHHRRITKITLLIL